MSLIEHHTPLPANAYIFECSTNSYLGSVQKGLFASNLPWPLQIRKGDYCCLYHYEVGSLFALWQATTDGARNLAPKAWHGQFPFQVKVALITPEIVEIQKATIPESLRNPATGKFDNVLDHGCSEALINLVTSRPFTPAKNPGLI